VKVYLSQKIIIGGYFIQNGPQECLPFSSRSAPATNVHPIETGYCHRSLLRNGNYHDISGFNAIRFFSQLCFFVKAVVASPRCLIPSCLI
jgi:hypothetical protein